MTDTSSDATSLRPLRESDCPAVLSAFLSHHDMVRQGNITSTETATAYVAHLLHPDGPHRAFAVVVGDDLVGLVALTVDPVNRNGWFWYWMHADFRGRGWTSRAAVTVADWALGVGGVERLELGHRANNPASASVALAAGFVHEGTERRKFLVDGERIDVLTYSRLRTDPAPSTPGLALWEA